MRKAVAWPDSEPESRLQLKESNRTMLEFLPDDAIRL